MKLKLQLLFLLVSFFGQNLATATEVVRFRQPNRLVAIGDIHGDGAALRTILGELKVIDSSGKWIGNDTFVVLMGDILDRGNDSRSAVDLLIRLEREAKLTGGRVVTIMGNHELMVAMGDLRYFSKSDALNYLDFDRNNDANLKQIVLNAFAPSEVYGAWIASLPAMIVVGNTLFVHGGPGSWTQRFSIEEVNALVKSWLHYFQGNGPRPDPRTSWVIGNNGPLWSRMVANFLVTKNALTSWLKAAGVKQVVMGHTVTPTLEPVIESQAYGRSVIMLDTGISHGMGGNLSAVEWTKGSGPNVRIFSRPKIQIHEHDQIFDLFQPTFREEDGIDYVPKIKLKLPDQILKTEV